MTDWIHCNSCFLQPRQDSKFFLTSCGHVFCITCLDRCTKPKCDVCGNECNVIPLSSKLKPEVEVFFRDPTDVVKRHSQELQKVLEFQRGHRKRILTKTKEKLERAKALYEEFKKATTYIQDLERKNKMLMQENAYLKQHATGNRIDEYGKTGPASQHKQSYRPSSVQMNQSFLSPSPTLPPGNSYPPPPPQSRLTIRTPPSGGRMGAILGSNMSTPCSSQMFQTPMSLGTPTRSYSPSPQSSQPLHVEAMRKCMTMPNLSQIKLPSGSRSIQGSSGGSYFKKQATVSPYSPQNTPG